MRVSILLLGLALSLPAHAEEAVQTEQHARPVVSLIVDPQAGISLSYTGTVVARTETALGFPMSGTVATRPVSTGDLVKKGDVLARSRHDGS